MPYYLTLELAAVVLPWLLPGRASTAQDWTWFAVLLATAVAQAELSAQVERMRRFFASYPHVNMTSVWLFAAALLLPVHLACVLAVLLYAHLWFRVWRTVPRVHLYRVVCSAATVVLTVIATAHAALSLPFGLLSIVVGGLTFMVVNTGLVAIGFRLHHPSRTVVQLTGAWAENVLDATTLCLGGITAVLLIEHPAMIALMLLPVVLLPRGELGRELQLVSEHDHKTGVLTVGEWHKRAETELARAENPCGVLMIDVDHFKRINDTYGHLTGDAVLSAVAGTVTREVRSYDLVGRFGGEEFVVLMPLASPRHSTDVAERVRHAVEQLEVAHSGTVVKGITVSIGVAVHPHAGSSLEHVLAVADKAMYRAKNRGRNQVCTALREPGDQGPSRGWAAAPPP
ncbi:hypothetical protein ALI144C_04050 [Actinosynnema sp. ALI-1.44]|uniref:GGDEF domain-containing protein n=1 Tax=Actinosynnema sp. ALI-1.44 TaxID=1933779 RepID=UPI00097C2F19|nr:GGDEF domain-containing protein [Actinosynnema sp. ALI-1.44]ONI89870.1 hypothetical protein ALI144C_04050 [Actinosynnema sp. ALI-1.44]